MVGHNVKDMVSMHTELALLERLQVSPGAGKGFYGGDVVLILEARKELEVFLGLEEGLALADLLLDLLALADDGVDDGAGFGEIERGYAVEFAQLEHCGCLFVAGRWSFGTRSSVRDMARGFAIRNGGIGHVGQATGLSWRRGLEATARVGSRGVACSG